MVAGFNIINTRNVVLIMSNKCNIRRILLDNMEISISVYVACFVVCSIFCFVMLSAGHGVACLRNRFATAMVLTFVNLILAPELEILFLAWRL